MMNPLKPYIIDFQSIGKESEGFLSIISEGDHIPFSVQRIFTTHNTPTDVTRGRHAHYETEMILICNHGRIIVATEDVYGHKDEFILEDPSCGVFLPKLCWHEMSYSEGAIQLVLCSTLYREEDYIRDYDRFSQIQKDHSIDAHLSE